MLSRTPESSSPLVETPTQREMELENDLELLQIEFDETASNNLLVLKSLLMQCGGDVTIAPQVIEMLTATDNVVVVSKTLEDNSLWIYLVKADEDGGLGE